MSECDREASIIRRPYVITGLCTMETKYINISIGDDLS